MPVPSLLSFVVRIASTRLCATRHWLEARCGRHSFAQREHIVAWLRVALPDFGVILFYMRQFIAVPWSLPAADVAEIADGLREGSADIPPPRTRLGDPTNPGIFK